MLSDQDARKMSIMKTRRDLLTVLKLFYPTPMPLGQIRLTAPDIDETNLRKDLAYLCDKGYVQRVNVQPNQRQDDREYKLTASGVETADRIHEDPALMP